VLPQSWAGDTITMRCTPVVRPALGPHSASLDASCHGLAFHPARPALYVSDRTGLHRFRVPEPPAAALSWPVAAPAGVDLPIRALDFGPDGELYAVSSNRVFRIPPDGGPAALLAGGGPAGNDATGAAAGFQDLWGIAVGQVGRPPAARAARLSHVRAGAEPGPGWGGGGRRRASS
jgi:hypothetical protein